MSKKLCAVFPILSALLLSACGGGGGGGAPAVAPVVVAASQPPVVYFMGDSITSQWKTSDCIAGSVNAGVPGNFTWQMADRFQADVVAKLDKTRTNILVYLGGTNDIAGGAFNTLGTSKVLEVANAARAAGMTPILGTIPPNSDIPTTWGWGPNIVPEWNRMIREMVSTNGFKLVDYYPLFVNSDGSQNMTLFQAPDTVHPNESGNALMCDALKKVIAGL